MENKFSTPVNNYFAIGVTNPFKNKQFFIENENYNTPG
jgi:hypothetical protein